MSATSVTHNNKSVSETGILEGQATVCTFNGNPSSISVSNHIHTPSLPLSQPKLERSRRNSTTVRSVKTVPAPRLVGIELNPGPGKKTARINRPKVVARKPRKALPSYNPMSHPMTHEYCSSLVDPWEHSGCKLGWGTMVQSTIAQAYLRGTTTANSDGTLVLAALPLVSTITDSTSANTFSLLTKWSAGNAVATCTGIVPTDSAAILANYTDIRPISIGIRSYPVIAATAQPGIVFSGALPPSNVSQLAALTPADFISFPTSHMSPGISGGSSTGRPVDPTSFVFSDDGLVSYTTLALSSNGDYSVPFSVPYQVYTGLGTGITVAYEVVYNFEGTVKLQHAAAPLGQSATSDGGMLSNIWNTVEQLWNGVKDALTPSGRPGVEAAVQDVNIVVDRLLGKNGKRKLIRQAGTSLAYAAGRAGLSYLAGGFGGASGAAMMLR